MMKNNSNAKRLVKGFTLTTIILAIILSCIGFKIGRINADAGDRSSKSSEYLIVGDENDLENDKKDDKRVCKYLKIRKSDLKNYLDYCAYVAAKEKFGTALCWDSVIFNDDSEHKINCSRFDTEKSFVGLDEFGHAIVVIKNVFDKGDLDLEYIAYFTDNGGISWERLNDRTTLNFAMCSFPLTDNYTIMHGRGLAGLDTPSICFDFDEEGMILVYYLSSFVPEAYQNDEIDVKAFFITDDLHIIVLFQRESDNEDDFCFYCAEFDMYMNRITDLYIAIEN